MHRAIPVFALLLVASSMAAAALPIYSPEEIRKGVHRDSAISRFSALGYKVTDESSPGRGFHIHDAATNKPLGVLYFCDGRLFANSVDVPGSAVGLVRRVAQFNASHGKATVVAESKVLDVGEFNSLTFSWSKADETVNIQFHPGGPKMHESQWVTYSVPSVCKQR